VTSLFGIEGAFFVFLETTRRICAKFFFSWFRRKHLFITTCIEKQCTPAFNTRSLSCKSYLYSNFWTRP